MVERLSTPSSIRHLGCICASLGVMMAAGSGCASRQPVGTQVRNVSFEGNGMVLSARSNSALRNAMGHPVPRGLPGLKRKVPLDRQTLEADRKRIAVYYAERGYFDAKVVDWRIETVREGTDDKPPVVTITGILEEGPTYPITEAQVEGLDEIDPPPPPPDGTFSASDYDAFQQTGLWALQTRGHAYAEVDGEVRVDRDAREVELDVQFEPGPTATFGEVTIDGSDGVPDRIVQQAIAVEPGGSYTPEDIEETKRGLYGLRIFSFVTVDPDRSRESTDQVVPVNVHVEKRDPRSVRGGVGVNLQSGRQEALLRVGFEHRNAFQRLIRLRARAQGGYALLATSLDELSNPSELRQGIVVESEVGGTVPGVGFPGWEVDLELAFDRNLTEAFVVDRPTATLSYVGPLNDVFDLGFAYRLRYAAYSDVQLAAEALRRETGNLDLRDGQYFVTELEETLTFDTRDDPLMPTHGMRHQLRLSQAGRFLGGNYDYLGARLDLRGYEALGRTDVGQLVLAGRVGGGWQVPYGPDERRAVPVAERLYLGGAQSVRGWIYQHLGPYICDVDSAPCSSTDDPATPEDDIVPIGGTVASWASLELRASGERLGGAIFSDWGMVWRDRESLSSTPVVAPSVGVGGRLITPAGPLRLDVAARTGNQRRYRSEPRLWLHLGIGEAF